MNVHGRRGGEEERERTKQDMIRLHKMEDRAWPNVRRYIHAEGGGRERRERRENITRHG